MGQIPSNRAEGAFLGLALGDAYGRPLEFIDGLRVRNTKVFIDTTSFKWTDDTHMALYLADAVLQMPANSFNDDNFGHLVGTHFCLWLEDPMMPSTNPGNTCLAGMQNYKAIRDWENSGVKNSDGCGAVMRICPLAMSYSGKMLDRATEISALITHAHPNAIAASVAASRLLRQTLESGLFTQDMVVQMAQDIRREYPNATDVPTALEAAVIQSRKANLDWLDEKAIPPKDGGWRSPSALGLAVTAVLHWGDDFATAVDKAARINGDSDSVACLTGMFIGACKGVGALPSSWLNAIPMREDIRRKAQQLIAPPRIKEPSIADKIRQLSDLGVSFYPDPNLQQNGVIIEVLSTNDPACQALTELVTQLGTDLKEADGYLSTKVDRSLVPADIRRLANQTHIPEPKAFSEVNSGVFDNDIIDVEPVDDTATTARTSISNPIDVDWVLTDIGEGHGSLGITFAPGKKASSMFGPPWRRDLAIDLDRLKAKFRTDALVSLIEEKELGELGIPNLVADAAERHIAVYRCPIVDGSIPSLQQARNVALFALTLARAGRNVVFHCRGGLGRAGTLTAISLLHVGYSPEEAIQFTRKHREGAIENTVQEGFIFEYAQYLSR